MEVIFQEARRHLEAETQRQWAEPAIRRTTSALLSLFSLVTLLAHQRMTRTVSIVRQTAWYRKAHPTFSDALALVRRELWAHGTFYGSPREADTVKSPAGVGGTPSLVERLKETLCYAA